jgi:hypothetical protein
MAGNILVPIISSFNSKGIKDAEKAIGGLAGALGGLGRKVAGAAAGVVGFNAVSNFTKDAVSAASDLQRNFKGVETIFGSSADAMKQFASQGTQMGLSTADAARAVTFLGSVFKQTGMPMDEVIGKTKTMVSLASDLAVTYGYSVDEALTAMTATFRGEYDPIEKFGVAMKQQQVNAILAAQGMGHLTGAALIAAQQQVRYNMILERTSDAQGAFGRQSGTLAVQQAVLQATWTNMQASLGNQLIPTLTAFALKLQPLVERFGPRLEGVFKAIGKALEAILPMIPAFMDTVASIFTVLSNISNAVSGPMSTLLGLIKNNTVAFLGFFAVITNQGRISLMITGFSALAGKIKLLTEVTKGLTGVTRVAAAVELLFWEAAAGPVGLVIAGLALLAGAIGAVIDGYGLLAKEADKRQKQLANLPKQVLEEANAAAQAAAEQAKALGADPGLAAKAAWQQAIDKYTEYQKLMLGQGTGRSAAQRWGKDIPVNIAPPKKVDPKNIGAVVKTWFDTLSDEVKKASDRRKLLSLGASQALADSILGGADWATAFEKAIKKGAKGIKSLQALFDKTAEGQKALEEAAKARQDAIDKIVADYKDVMSQMDAFKPLKAQEEQLGRHAQAVEDAMVSLHDSLQKAFDNKTITAQGMADLEAYARQEKAALLGIAKQRDVLAQKISIAQAVTSNVLSFANITSVLKGQTSQVTESYKKIIDGVEVTVTKTVEAMTSGDITSAYQDVLAKTKQFLANLDTLKKFGLNSTLFKQIVDAGVDAGGATAQAIVDGGQATVGELNNLFSDLNSTASDIAATTNEIMYSVGEDVTNAFIEGLKSQDEELRLQAEAMATAFTNAFNANLKLAVPSFALPAIQASQTTGPSIMDSIGATSLAGAYASGQTSWLSGILGQSPTALTAEQMAAVKESNSSYIPRGDNSSWNANMGSTYNVTVNAGLGTDGSNVGKTVVQILKQYERNNGAVWVSV